MLNCDTARFDGKNIALIYVGDNSGCSHVRLRYNAMYFDGIDTGVIPIIMPVFTFEHFGTLQINRIPTSCFSDSRRNC